MLVWRGPRRAALQMGDERDDERGVSQAGSEAVVERQFTAWTDRIREGIGPHIEHAIATGQTSAIVHSSIWHLAWQEVTPEWNAGLQQLLVGTAQKEIRKLRFDFAFTVDNPYALRWAKDFSAERVTQVTDATRNALRDAVAEAFRSNIAPAKLAPIIRPMIGLTDRQAQAVVNRAFGKLADGMAPEKVRADAERYSNRLLRQRAALIAQHETVTAENKGLQASWQTARDKGLVQPHAKRVWIAAMGSDRTCEACEDFGSAQNRVTGLDEPFRSSRHGECEGAPCHVGCRCTQGLVTKS